MNKKESKIKLTKIIISLFILLTVAIIWGHSFMTPEMSTEESSFVKEIVEAVVQSVSNNQAFTIPEIVIRKSAHFFEYAILGLELAILITVNIKTLLLKEENSKLNSNDGSHKKKGFFQSLSCRYITSFMIALIVAGIDETIQYFTGRYSSVWDVLLDMTGASFSILVFLLIRVLFLRRRK